MIQQTSSPMWDIIALYCVRGSINPFLGICSSKNSWSYSPGRTIDMEVKNTCVDPTICCMVVDRVISV